MSAITKGIKRKIWEIKDKDIRNSAIALATIFSAMFMCLIISAIPISFIGEDKEEWLYLNEMANTMYENHIDGTVSKVTLSDSTYTFVIADDYITVNSPKYLATLTWSVQDGKIVLEALYTAFDGILSFIALFMLLAVFTVFSGITIYFIIKVALDKLFKSIRKKL